MAVHSHPEAFFSVELARSFRRNSVQQLAIVIATAGMAIVIAKAGMAIVIAEAGVAIVIAEKGSKGAPPSKCFVGLVVAAPVLHEGVRRFDPATT